jgi:hypothetical protein
MSQTQDYIARRESNRDDPVPEGMHKLFLKITFFEA